MLPIDYWGSSLHFYFTFGTTCIGIHLSVGYIFFWDTSSRLDNNANLLTSIADVYGLQQLIIDPTRCTESSSTLIDLIFTNSPESVVCSGVSHISISDHFLVYALRKLSINQPSMGHTTVTYRKFKNCNSVSFRDDISQQNWDDIYNYDDPNGMWDAWKRLFF